MMIVEEEILIKKNGKSTAPEERYKQNRNDKYQLQDQQRLWNQVKDEQFSKPLEVQPIKEQEAKGQAGITDPVQPDLKQNEVELTQFNSPSSPEKRNSEEKHIQLQPVLQSTMEPAKDKEEEISVDKIDPKKPVKAPSSSMLCNVSFANKDNHIDFNPSEKKKHPLSPVKVTRVDPRLFEAGGYPKN